MEALENFLRKEFYWLHRHPEVSFEEIETTAHLYNLLVENGVRVLDLSLKTGIVAEISSWSFMRVMASSAANGSSMKRMSGSTARARAMATRCCMPPDSSAG